MFNWLSKHVFYYLCLFVIFSLGLFLVYANSSNKVLQVGVVAITTIFYIFWGILHHYLKHDLHTKIVIEYILIGSLGMALIVLLINNI